MSYVFLINLRRGGGGEGIPIFNIYRYMGVNAPVAVLIRVLTKQVILSGIVVFSYGAQKHRT